MAGRIRKKLLLDRAFTEMLEADPVCPLCGRPIPASQRDAHHLLPKSRGGRETITLHRICHRQIHAVITEKHLAENYCSISALLGHPEIAKFVTWVRRKPDDFYERTRKSSSLRRRK